MQTISRIDALLADNAWYFTGEPCKHGHITKRRTCNTRCRDCEIADSISAADKYGPVEAKRRRRAWHLNYNFGMTLDAWDTMLASQNNRCAICGSDEPGMHTQWAVDHDHATGKVRAILCNPCNCALGNVRDSIPTLANMITYLELHK